MKEIDAPYCIVVGAAVGRSIINGGNRLSIVVIAVDLYTIVYRLITIT